MLIAKNQDDCYVSLLTFPREELQKHKKNIYYCPCCSGRVFLKAGKIKMPHFAHAPHTTCHAATEGETEEHLSGKKMLYEWLEAQGYEPELEKYFPDFQQRADVFVRHNGKDYAIEYQCSVISPDELKRRTRMYLNYRITPIWILSDRHVKWKKRNSFMLSAFQWTASSGNALLPQLFALSVKTSQMTILQQLIPFSERNVFAYPQIVRLHTLSFSELLSTRAIFPFQQYLWQNKKQSWRLFANAYATVDQPFFNALYEGGYSPATIPNECGIPVPYMHLYQTSAVQWQFWLYAFVLRRKRAGDFVGFGEWRSALVRCLKEEKIILRQLVHVRMNPFMPMEQYIRMLEKMKVLKAQKGGHIYDTPFEKYDSAIPEKEEDFFKTVKRYYEELMASACEKFD